MAQASIKAIAGSTLAALLLATGASPAAAQISIPLPGTGSGSIQIGPQPDQRYQDPNRIYSGAVSIRVLGAVYGNNCAGQANTNFTDDLARQCQGRDYCVYRIDMRQLGDPRPGCAKDYHARYMCRDGGNERRASAGAEASGQSVVLDCRQ
jgi:hypothetical protein